VEYQPLPLLSTQDQGQAAEKGQYEQEDKLVRLTMSPASPPPSLKLTKLDQSGEASST
jgi:hypothetical protein